MEFQIIEKRTNLPYSQWPTWITDPLIFVADGDHFSVKFFNNKPVPVFVTITQDGLNLQSELPDDARFLVEAKTELMVSRWRPEAFEKGDPLVFERAHPLTLSGLIQVTYSDTANPQFVTGGMKVRYIFTPYLPEAVRVDPEFSWSWRSPWNPDPGYGIPI